MGDDWLKSKIANRQILTYLVIIFSFFLVGSLVWAYSVRADYYAQKYIKVYIFSLYENSRNEIVFSYFNNRADCEVVFHSIRNSFALENFLKIVNILVMRGIDFTRFCVPCEQPDATLEDIYKTSAMPLVGLFQGGKLRVITVGVTYYKILDKALASTLNSSALAIFTDYDLRWLSDEGIRVRLKELFTEQESNDNKEMDLLNLASFITLLAIIDSVNPCTFAVFTALLLIALHSLGRMRAVASGLSFILAIFVGYYALGLGLFRILTYIPFINRIVASVGLLMGASSIIYGLKPNFRSPIPKFLRKHMEIWISKSYSSSIASFVLGLAASFTLLPCSSGPYIVGLGLISTLGDSIGAYFLLILYVAIFVSPLIIILIALLAFGGMPRKIKVFRNSKLGVMELIIGVILVLVCLYLLLY